MNQTEKEKNFWEFINLLNSKNLLNNVVIIGSWAEMLYEKKYDFISKSFTNDIDIFYKNINYSDNKILLTKELEQLGYDVNIDRNSKIATYYKDGFEIEILTEMRGSSDSVNFVKSLGIYGEGLRYLDITDKFIETVIVNNVSLQIPNPCAYVIHKLLINKQRLSIEKREKDIDKVKNLLILIRENKDLQKDFKKVYDYTLSKYNKAKDTIDECCAKYDIDLSDLILEFTGDLTIYILENNYYKRITQENFINKVFSNDRKKGRDFWYSLKDLVTTQGINVLDCKYLIREKNGFKFIAGIKLNEILANKILKGDL